LEQQQVLSRQLKGHDAYYGITGNARALMRFRFEVQRRWHRWLNRRSHATRLDWPAFERLLKRYPLPPARAIHSIYAT
jgi:RNA-directed DNA polymerase